ERIVRPARAAPSLRRADSVRVARVAVGAAERAVDRAAPLAADERAARGLEVAAVAVVGAREAEPLVDRHAAPGPRGREPRRAAERGADRRLLDERAGGLEHVASRAARHVAAAAVIVVHVAADRIAEVLVDEEIAIACA